MDDYVQKVTEHSIKCLKADFVLSLNHARGSLRGSPDAVIDGERNPFDFVHLFDPKYDLVISLIVAGSPLRTEYEKGLLTIWSYLEWLLANRFIIPQQHRRYELSCLYTRERLSESTGVVELDIARITSIAVSDVDLVRHMNDGR
jgi:hypothetical protein